MWISDSKNQATEFQRGEWSDQTHTRSNQSQDEGTGSPSTSSVDGETHPHLCHQRCIRTLHPTGRWRQTVCAFHWGNCLLQQCPEFCDNIMSFYREPSKVLNSCPRRASPWWLSGRSEAMMRISVPRIFLKRPRRFTSRLMKHSQSKYISLTNRL